MIDFDISDADRYEALAKANDMRHERSVLRKRIKSGELGLPEIFAMEGSLLIDRMKVSVLIESMPGFGKAKAAKLMEELKIAPTRRIQGLGERQRRELIERFG